MQLVYLLPQPKITKDVAKFMKSLDFGSARVVTTEDEMKNIPSNKKEEKNSVQERVSNRKADARVAEVAVKVAENTKGGKPKFVRVISHLARVTLYVASRLYNLLRNGT